MIPSGKTVVSSPSLTPIVGFTTMTADLFHVAHLNFLKSCKALCDQLIVGVTVDARCHQRKRQPIIPFEQRKAIVEAIRYVDLVVEDAGQPKHKMCDDLNVSRVFIGDDYCAEAEYLDLRNSRPNVQVYFIPRTSHISTTALIKKIKHDILTDVQVLNYGISGPLLCFPIDKKHSIVCKPVVLGATESSAENGADVYGIATPLPRNWKVGKVVTNQFPMISGVNGWREIIVMRQLRDVPFVPYLGYYCVHIAKNPIWGNDEKMSRIDKMQHERKYPAKTLMIHMSHAGSTLNEYIRDFRARHSHHDTSREFQRLCAKIATQIEVLREKAVIHGDLHPNNICVSTHKSQEANIDQIDTEISFVDFGWSMSRECAMSPEEQTYFYTCLSENFDWQHFYDSLESFDLLQYYH